MYKKRFKQAQPIFLKSIISSPIVLLYYFQLFIIPAIYFNQKIY